MSEGSHAHIFLTKCLQALSYPIVISHYGGYVLLDYMSSGWTALVTAVGTKPIMLAPRGENLIALQAFICIP